MAWVAVKVEALVRGSRMTGHGLSPRGGALGAAPILAWPLPRPWVIERLPECFPQQGGGSAGPSGSCPQIGWGHVPQVPHP